MAIIGIDLGTTNSLAVCWKDGKADIIKNSFGEVSTPSVVSIGDDGEISVGKVARERLIPHPDKTAAEFKRSMGLKKPIHLGDTEYLPEELSALVLRKIREDAEKYLGEPVTEAVISVPAYYDDNCRSAAKHAARLAGINVERLVNEPSAAALAYQAKHGYNDGTLMIVDFGGGTLDISVVDAFDSVIEILAVAGNNHLGGKDFNEAVAEYFCRENGLDYRALSPDNRAIVYKLAESCKIALSSAPASMMSANIDGKQYTAVIDNNKLIEISAPVFEKIAEPMRRALKDSGCTAEDIDDIILVGGSCKMPTVQAFVEKIMGKAPCTDIDPDTAIAVGAGIFAGIKNRDAELKDVILTDICPFSLGTNVYDKRLGRESMDFIIQRNTSLPSSFVKEYYGGVEGQTKISIKIYQGESMWPEKNLYLGELLVKCPPAPLGKPICSVRMTYDINGILAVDVTTYSDGMTHSKVLLSESNSMTEAEVSACIARMEKLKISPAEKDENKLIIARAERIIEESLSTERDFVMGYLRAFLGALESQNNREIRERRTALCEMLDNIED